MLLLKPGEEIPAIQKHDSRPGSSESRASSASRKEKKGPMIPRKIENSEMEVLKEHLQQSLPSVEQTYMKITAMNVNNSKDSKKLKIQQEGSVNSNNDILNNQDLSGDDLNDDHLPDDSDSDSNGTDNDNVQDISTVPLDLKLMFVNAVMEKDYVRAQQLCQEILAIEPNNSTCLEYKTVLIEALIQEAETTEENESSSDESDSENTDDEEETSGSEDDDTVESEESDDEEVAEDAGEESDSDSEDELTADDIRTLNLLVGGLHISRTEKE